MRVPTYRRLILGCLMLLAGSAYAQEANSVRMGVPFPEDTKEWHAMMGMATRIAERTEGRFVITLVPPDPDARIAERLASGQLDGGFFAATDLTDLELGPDALAYAIPFMFRSHEQADFVRNAVDPIVLKNLSQGPYEALSIAELGFAYVMSSQPLASPADWGALKVWAPEHGIYTKVLDGLGLTTVRIPLDSVRQAIKKGQADTIIAPPAGAILKRWHTHLANMFELPFTYTYGIWIVKDELMPKLTADKKDLLRQELRNGLAAAFKARAEEAHNVLTKWGVTFVSPVPGGDMWEKWSQWAAAVWDFLEPDEKPSTTVREKLKECLDAFDEQQESSSGN